MTEYEAWQALLADHGSLAPKFVKRYAALFTRLKTAREFTACADRLRAQGLRALVADVVRELRLGEPILDAPPLSDDAVRCEGDATLAGLLRDVAAGSANLGQYISRQQWLETTRVPIAPNREARIIRDDPDGSGILCAVRWSGRSVAERQRNAELFQVTVLDGIELPVPATVVTEYALVWSGDADGPMAVSRFLGVTLEEALRRELLTANERRDVLRSLQLIRQRMIRAAAVWQGFAPRNMFYLDGALHFIDFEAVAFGESQIDAAWGYLQWHEVFFADCLTATEFSAMFGQGECASVSAPDRVPADAFEQLYFGTPVISAQQRAALLAATFRLESRHARPHAHGSDNGILFGHELGHFWGDFLAVRDEVRMHRSLEIVGNEPIRTACLEALEAAMEADIGLVILNREGANLGDTSRHTRAVISCLEDCGADAVARARSAAHDWYERLEREPWSLVEHVILSSRSDGRSQASVSLPDLFVGDAKSQGEQLRHLYRAVDIGMTNMQRKDNTDSFLRHASVSELVHAVEESVPEYGADLSLLLDDLAERIVPFSIRQHHSKYIAFPDSGNSLAAMVGAVVSKFLNQNLIAVDRSAPIATFVEIQVIEWLRKLIGYDTTPLSQLHGVGDTAGLWMPGGHLSNHTAMLAALGTKYPQVRQDGLWSLGFQPTVLMAGAIAHYSHSDAAFHLGLGWSAVQNVDSADGYTTDPASLAKALRDQDEKKRPFSVIAVAGNCRTTGIDPIDEIADVCEEFGVWLHVDACHGGSLLFSEKLKARHLKGMERADSVSIDPHKGLFTPYPSSYLLFRDRGVLRQFSRHDKAVRDAQTWDLGLVTPFLGSRGFESLATWLMLRHIGVRALGAVVESRHAFTRVFEQWLWDSGMFICVNDVDFYRVAFVYAPGRLKPLLQQVAADGKSKQATEVVSRFTSELGRRLYVSGVVCLDEHTLLDLGNRVGLGSRTKFNVLAICPGNPLTQLEDLQDVFRAMVSFAHELYEDFERDLHGIVQDRASDKVAEPVVSGPAGWG